MEEAEHERTMRLLRRLANKRRTPSRPTIADIVLMVDQVRKMADRRADPVGQAAVSVLETLVEALIAGSVEGMVVALVTFEKKEFGRMRELRSRKKST